VSDELLDVLDDEGRAVGTAPRDRVHALGLPHRAVHVLVRDLRGRLLLQLRSSTKGTCPGMWDTSVGGHVGAGEDALESALRETAEELGVVVAPSALAALPGHRVDLPNDREHVVNFELRHEGPFRPDPTEVESVAWYDARQIDALVARGACTPHFAIQWNLWLAERLAGAGA